MKDLNQFAISKILGSKIKQIAPVGFGNFASIATVEEVKRGLRGDCRDLTAPAFGYDQDAVVVRAFEDVRNGAPTDELLWNKHLARSLASRCRAIGLDAPQSYLIRRLITVRKNAPRYKEHGIGILPTTKKESHPSIVPEFAHVVEFALVRLRFRYGSSIDDILMDESLGDKFEELAHQIAPSLSSKDLRLGALYIRKNRVMKRKDLATLDALDIAVIDSSWQASTSLAELRPDDIPASPGLIGLKEEGRYLYISHNKNIQSAVRPFGNADAFRLMASTFWKPQPDAITLAFATGEKVAGTAIETWERKLIQELEPVFNWPMPRRAA
jgi:hypothetical protein